jgi:hypothetical protein
MTKRSDLVENQGFKSDSAIIVRGGAVYLLNNDY